jgi:hypothetical protein
MSARFHGQNKEATSAIYVYVTRRQLYSRHKKQATAPVALCIGNYKIPVRTSSSLLIKLNVSRRGYAQPLYENIDIMPWNEPR